MWKPCWCERTLFWCGKSIRIFLMLWREPSSVLDDASACSDSNRWTWTSKFFWCSNACSESFLMLWCDANAFWCCDCSDFCDSSWFDVRICSFGWCSVLMWISCVFFSWTRSQRISDVMMWFFWCVKLPEDFSSENVSNRFWCDEGCFFFWSDAVSVNHWCDEVARSIADLISFFWRCLKFFWWCNEMPWNFSDVVMLDRFFWCQSLVRCSDRVLMLWLMYWNFFWCPKNFLMPENFFWCPKRFSDVNLMLFCWSWFNKFLDSCVVRGCEFTGVVDLWDDLGLLRRSLATWRSETKSVTTIQPGIDLLVSILSWLNLHRCTSRRPAWLDLMDVTMYSKTFMMRIWLCYGPKMVPERVKIY